MVKTTFSEDQAYELEQLLCIIVNMIYDATIESNWGDIMHIVRRSPHWVNLVNRAYQLHRKKHYYNNWMRK